MNFDYYVAEAAQRALDMDGLPDDLLPLVIVSEVARLSPISDDLSGHGVWH